MKNIYDFTLEALTEQLKVLGLPKFTAQQLFIWVYKKRLEDFSKMSNLSKETRAILNKEFVFSEPTIAAKEKSSDGTVKFLLELFDKNRIETVLIPKDERATLCLSTQVGCKFKCVFCASGALGFQRNLKVYEIISQYLKVSDIIEPKKITNIVFMGIGEPLDNFDNLLEAIKILTSHAGIAFVKRKICVSTCGLLPQLNKLADKKLGIKLSISLHSADDAVRSKLMPINKTYPLSKLIGSAKAFANSEKYLVTFEYALISGLNTSKEDALKLSRLLRGFRYKLNLIPLNYFQGEFKTPASEEVKYFLDELKKRKVFFTIRQSRGSDISAACGQLRASASQKF